MHRLEKDLTMITSTPSGSAKKPGGWTQTVSCSVDGCSSDLSKCKLYHRRHRVCERHSKAPVVTVRGQKKRFCQQCSRFHSLEEFDEVKRSCRKRLAGHNRRRRKPKPGSLGGIKFLQFGAPQIPAVTTAISYQNQPLLSNTFTWTYSAKYDRFPFMEPKHHQSSSEVAAASGDCFSLPHLQSIQSSESGRGSHESDENIQSINSNSALYLLSMNSLPTPGISLNHFVQSNLINPVLSQGSEMQASTVAMLSPILFSGVRETYNGCNGMFDARSDSLLAHGMCSTLPGL